MNAKKIMGAVLVALLALTAFAGVAAAEGTDYGTVFIYQNETTLPAGAWTLVGGSAVVSVVGDARAVMPGADFVAGTYKLGADTVYFCKPTASYALTATIGSNPAIDYIVANGGKVYNKSNLDLKVTPLNESFSGQVMYYITYPNGTKVNTSDIITDVNKKGTYKVQALFKPANFVKGVPEELLLDANSFSFTVVGDEDVEFSASVDTAYSGEVVTFTLVGTPGVTYTVNFTGVTVPANQLKYLELIEADKSYNITIGNSGKATFEAIVDSSKVADVTKKEAVAKIVSPQVKESVGKIVVKISAPVVTAKAEKESYIIGEDIKLTGTSTADAEFTFNITGINYKSTPLYIEESEFGTTWEVTLSTAELVKKLDVGAYTIEVIQGGAIVKTVTVNLKQPFITIISAPEVIAQDTEAKFLINAEATTQIQAFVFGTNYFANYTMDNGISVADPEDLPNEFTITLGKGDTKIMDAGQYFMVIQHPMYDKKFNVTETDGKFYESSSVNDNKALFDVFDRQTANAAQALCDALDSQNFDDMYVKYSFFIVGQDESFSIGEIPSTIAQGETLTISGVDTANAGETIQVTMLSTAFAAVPKETTGSAAFILVTTEIAEDGTWEVTLDTSSLAIDEYNLAVKIQGAADDMKNVRINVVEAADEPVNPEQPEDPEQPEQPEEPVAPATPGFGALAALAGLGAVAVLLLRRE